MLSSVSSYWLEPAALSITLDGVLLLVYWLGGEVVVDPEKCLCWNTKQSSLNFLHQERKARF